jgi:hypothetical protein
MRVRDMITDLRDKAREARAFDRLQKRMLAEIREIEHYYILI